MQKETVIKGLSSEEYVYEKDREKDEITSSIKKNVVQFKKRINEAKQYLLDVKKDCEDLKLDDYTKHVETLIEDLEVETYSAVLFLEAEVLKHTETIV